MSHASGYSCGHRSNRVRIARRASPICATTVRQTAAGNVDSRREGPPRRPFRHREIDEGGRTWLGGFEPVQVRPSSIRALPQRIWPFSSCAASQRASAASSQLPPAVSSTALNAVMSLRAIRTKRTNRDFYARPEVRGGPASSTIPRQEPGPSLGSGRVRIRSACPRGSGTARCPSVSRSDTSQSPN